MTSPRRTSSPRATDAIERVRLQLPSSRPPGRSGLPRIVALAVLLGAALPLPATAQECPRGRIAAVHVDNHSIFDLDDPELSSELRWAYGLANTLHMRTRRDLIRGELLFSEGECYDPLLLRESERLLRGYAFIARAEVVPLPQPDGDVEVLVDTQDEWTTKLDIRLVFDDGFEFRGIDVTEENFLGRGMTLGVFFLERDETRDVGARFGTPRLFGTRWDGSVTAGRTRIGDFFSQELSYPFVAEVGRWAARERLDIRESQFAYAHEATAGPEEPGPFTHLLLPVDRRLFDVSLAHRFGRPGAYTLLGGAVSVESLEFPDRPDRVEIVRDRDFGDGEPAPGGLRDRLAPHVNDLSSLRLNLLLGRRAIRFVPRSGLDALTGVQDVPLGTEVELNIGRSVGARSRDGLARTDDVAAGGELFAGFARGPWLVTANVLVEARRVLGGQTGGRGWRDVLAEADLLAYWKPELLPRHTVLLSVAGAGGWSTVTPFQLTLGGLRRVRGYRDERFPGGRRVIATVEDRIYVRWPAPSLFDIGFTLFGDVGRMWEGDVPLGVDSGWRGSLGAGLRIGFPPGTQRTIRADLAVPLRSDAGTSGPVFRLTFLELTGLLPGFRDPQMERSRRNPVGSDFLTFPN